MAALFRDHDTARLERRIAAVSSGELRGPRIRELIDGDARVLAQTSPETVRAIAPLMNDLRDAVVQLPAAEASHLETIIGSVDWLPISYLDLVRRAANAVARVAYLDGQGIATGVMVSPSLFMTNNHVFDSAGAARTFKAQFNYETSATGENLRPVDVRFAPEEFFWTSPTGELDVSLVAIAPEAVAHIRPFGWAPLSSAINKHADGDFVTIIQHPDRERKKVALRDNRIIGRGKGGITLHYSADTVGGSSGSPVFNDQLDLIALHHAWGGENETHLEDGRPVPDESNEGIRISAIVQKLTAFADRLPEKQRLLLVEALNPPVTTAIQVGDAAIVAANDAKPAAGSAVQDKPWVEKLPTASVTFPAGVEAATGASTAIRPQRPDPDYTNREGYDPKFLGKILKLPTVAGADQPALAKLLAPAEGQDPHILRYHHFSAVVRADRQLPAFTAVNIDGKASRSINRMTGQLEASETWFNDPRISPDDQLKQPYYAHQIPRIFDRGHLVRRLDPAWGPIDADAYDAEIDTFHFTNCCPQISTFNQHLWLSIEDFALENAKSEKDRITVISGPIFARDDPSYRDVRVPRRFWKVVVRVVNDRFRTTAFIADQAEQLDKALAPGHQEAFEELGPVAIYNKPLKDVADATGLKFEGLGRSDTFQRQVERAEPLSHPRDAAW